VVVDDKDVVERWEGGKFGGRDGRDGDLEVGDWTAGDSLKGDGVWTRTRSPSLSWLSLVTFTSTAMNARRPRGEGEGKVDWEQWNTSNSPTQL
jgi:hypothetical protein